LQNEKGEDVDVAKLAEGGKGVVLFLYPKVGSYTTSVGLY
jgi:hypothetical protein